MVRGTSLDILVEALAGASCASTQLAKDSGSPTWLSAHCRTWRRHPTFVRFPELTTSA